MDLSFNCVLKSKYLWTTPCNIRKKLLLALLTNTYRRVMKGAFHFVSVSLLIEAIQAVNKGNQIIVSLILLQWRIIFNRGPYRKVFFIKMNAVLWISLIHRSVVANCLDSNANRVSRIFRLLYQRETLLRNNFRHPFIQWVALFVFEQLTPYANSSVLFMCFLAHYVIRLWTTHHDNTSVLFMCLSAHYVKSPTNPRLWQQVQKLERTMFGKHYRWNKRHGKHGK